jgi:hypothetical protein
VRVSSLAVPCIGVFILCCLLFLWTVCYGGFADLLWRLFAKEGLLICYGGFTICYGGFAVSVFCCGILAVSSCGVLAFVVSAVVYALLSLIVGYLLLLSCNGLYLGKTVPKSI